jgi:hypothetical protein
MAAMAAARAGDAKAPPPTAGNTATDNATTTARNVRMMLMVRFEAPTQYPAGLIRPSSDVSASNPGGLTGAG